MLDSLGKSLWLYNMNRRQQFIVAALLLQVPLFGYPVLRLCHWLELGKWETLAIFLPLFFSQIVTRLYLCNYNNGLRFWLRRAADLWLGISPLLFGMVLGAELPVAYGWLSPTAAAYWLLALAGAVLVYSVHNAYEPRVVKVPITSPKKIDALRFVQITDVHIGSRSPKFLRRIIQKINTMTVDFVCITGDLVDSPGIGEEALAALRDCNVPIYFSIGNHERYEDLDQILHGLQGLGVQILRSATATQGAVQLIGIDDSSHPAQVGRELQKLSVAQDAFVLLLYHRPLGLTAAAAAGVDLMICGHTHNGQVFPFNLVVKRVFPRTVGLFSKGLTRLYVSPGTGTWGPFMRLGSRGEITLFQIKGTEQNR